ncbi:hypothetical protein MOTC310_18005 [Methylobacterium oryzae]|uniref:Uncharacterized protein n=1 Tax=Methylobacterium oryzae TaxID=334852 RepID=A0ABU7TR06_9HYPH
MAMAQDQSGGANPSAAEQAAAERVARKRLGPDGCPEPAPDPRSPAGQARGTETPAPGNRAAGRPRGGR